jgi:hypothetical protein
MAHIILGPLIDIKWFMKQKEEENKEEEEEYESERTQDIGGIWTVVRGNRPRNIPKESNTPLANGYQGRWNLIAPNDENEEDEEGRIDAVMDKDKRNWELEKGDDGWEAIGTEG